jgi:hypothetical protein
LNVDRRATAQVCIALLKECNEIGLISDASHVALTETLTTMRSQEFWQLRNQERHEGKNEPTDKQIAIARIALVALESAVEALAKDEFEEVIAQLTLAVTTDGTPAKKKRRA